ncbi:hypothetical protein BP5796_06000 [Coleophoma crateriformis]|uniref:Anaphase-promoting complex subunit 2 n=1 Tax=Coleophoma crateriformis TaxID=565419 RepID=A0A3D8RVX7_9HELO|nr:hypothetical protein BP5796_06000 [Coleophoma crateriformis]
MAGRDSAKRRVFAAVFPRVADSSQPTPVITPAAKFTTPGQAFGVPSPYGHDQASSSQKSEQLSRFAEDDADHVQQQVQWDRSWHTVTHFLSFAEEQGRRHGSSRGTKSADAAFAEALENVLNPSVRLPLAPHTEEILPWYTQHVRYHFLDQVHPKFLSSQKEQNAGALLSESIKILEDAHRQYFQGLSMIINQIDALHLGLGKEPVDKFRRDLHAIVSTSITEEFTAALKLVITSYVFTYLGIKITKEHGYLETTLESVETDQSRNDMLGLVEALHRVDLADEKFQVIFAEIMRDAMDAYIYCGYGGVWSAENVSEVENHQAAKVDGAPEYSPVPRAVHRNRRSICTTNLCEWVENRYSRLAVEVFDKIGIQKVTWADVEKWKEMSIGRLAILRTNELFDIVASWPHAAGALEDLRTAITSPQRRLHLTDVFASALKERLLHPGASTLQILQTYISMIWSFHALDNSKVLLDRVAYPLQLYLCSREDTVRIIITGLLSDTEDSQGTPVAPGGDKLVELAVLLNQGTDQFGQRASEDELDWSDMEWVPDPVDAGPGYKRSRNADIIGTLIGIKVLELLKARFGEAPLQSCEVMLKDIQDSGRVDGAVRKSQNLDHNEEEASINQINLNNDGKPSLHAKILSRLFWPQLPDESYRVPDEIADLQKRYEVGFESLKSSRKLTWLHALGQATVELELVDRTIREEVHTWQATVIWAFQSDEAGDSTLTRTIEELVEHLEMEESLVRSALNFWIGKLVLHEVEKDVFAVLETLNQEDRAKSNAQAAAAAAAAMSEGTDATEAMGDSDAQMEDKMQMYWKFIQGMLKNSSSQMPLQQIAMMLKMLIAEGFPYSNEELQEFLGLKVTSGELELAAGKYKLKK